MKRSARTFQIPIPAAGWTREAAPWRTDGSDLSTCLPSIRIEHQISETERLVFGLQVTGYWIDGQKGTPARRLGLAHGGKGIEITEDPPTIERWDDEGYWIDAEDVPRNQIELVDPA